MPTPSHTHRGARAHIHQPPPLHYSHADDLEEVQQLCSVPENTELNHRFLIAAARSFFNTTFSPLTFSRALSLFFTLYSLHCCPHKHQPNTVLSLSSPVHAQRGPVQALVDREPVFTSRTCCSSSRRAPLLPSPVLEVLLEILRSLQVLPATGLTTSRTSPRPNQTAQPVNGVHGDPIRSARPAAENLFRSLMLLLLLCRCCRSRS